MKMVVLDGHTLNPGDNPWTALEALSDELVVYDRTPPDRVVSRARGAAVLLTNKTPLDASVFAHLPELRFVSVLATGYDVVDVTAARRHGVEVSNVPEYGTTSVAQHTFALLLALARDITAHDAAIRNGEWAQRAEFSFWLRAPYDLYERRMGIVGFGKIGQAVGRIAHAFGMQVMAYDPALDPTPELPYEPATSLEELFASCDVISLHCPLTESNAHFVDAALLARVRPGTILLNTARGQLIDEGALAQALREGRLGGAGIDVVSTEPIRPTNPLLSAPRCILTPHMAWASLRARRQLMAIAVENVRCFLQGKPQNVVELGGTGARRGV